MRVLSVKGKSMSSTTGQGKIFELTPCGIQLIEANNEYTHLQCTYIYIAHHCELA